MFISVLSISFLFPYWLPAMALKDNCHFFITSLVGTESVDNLRRVQDLWNSFKRRKKNKQKNDGS